MRERCVMRREIEVASQGRCRPSTPCLLPLPSPGCIQYAFDSCILKCFVLCNQRATLCSINSGSNLPQPLRKLRISERRPQQEEQVEEEDGAKPAQEEEEH